MRDGSEAGFTLHDDVGNAHLAAQSGEEDDELDGVDVVRDDDECGFLGFDEGDDVVEAVLDEEGLLGVLLIKMSDVKERIKGMNVMNGPWRPSLSPRQQTQRQQSNGPFSPASTRGGICSTA